MHPFKEHIDIGATMNEVIHFMVEWRTLSILVTDKDRPGGRKLQLPVGDNHSIPDRKRLHPVFRQLLSVRG